MTNSSNKPKLVIIIKGIDVNFFEQYKHLRIGLENKFQGLRHEQTTLVKSLITLANPYTGIASDITYNDLCHMLTISPAPGRKDAGAPTKQTIRNYLNAIELECSDHFKVISKGQELKFLFPDMPKIFAKLFQKTEVNTHLNIELNTPDHHTNSGESGCFSKEVNIHLNTDVNTPRAVDEEVNTHLNTPHVLENKEQNPCFWDEVNTELNTPLYITKHNKTNKLTNLSQEFTISSKKTIAGDFYPSETTIAEALSLGLHNATDSTEIQAFITYNQQNQTEWEDFNPLFLRWLQRASRYQQKKTIQASKRTIRSFTHAKPHSNHFTNVIEESKALNAHGILPDGRNCLDVEAEYIHNDRAHCGSLDRVNQHIWSTVHQQEWEDGQWDMV